MEVFEEHAGKMYSYLQGADGHVGYLRFPAGLEPQRDKKPLLIRIASHFTRLELISVEAWWRARRIEHHARHLERHNAEMDKLQRRLSELGPFAGESD